MLLEFPMPPCKRPASHRRPSTSRVRFSHNAEVRPRDHARLDVIGEHLGLSNVAVVGELIDEYLHDRPLIAALVAAKLPREQGVTGGQMTWGARNGKG